MTKSLCHQFMLCVGLTVGLLVSALGEESTPPAEGVSDVHRILLGDRLRIHVDEEPDLSKVYAVAGDGTVDFGFIGRVNIAELTIQEAARKLEDLLESKYYRQATVSVTVSDFVEGNIMVLGAVKSPGSMNFRGDQMLTLMEAIISSGGLTENAAREVRILRWRPGAGLQREILTVDVRTMMDELDFSLDQFLRPRDIIMVSSVNEGGEGAQEYLVLGEVSNPGFFPYRKGMDLIRAVTRAGFSQSAMIDAVRILRPNDAGEYTPLHVDLARLFGSADMSMNIPILPGDILFVPSREQASRGKVYLLGQVQRRGSVSLPLTEEATLARLILDSGGLTEFANGSKVKILRRAPDGTKQVMYVDVDSILEEGAFEDDVPLEDGDVVIVSERLFGL